MSLGERLPANAPLDPGAQWRWLARSLTRDLPVRELDQGQREISHVWGAALAFVRCMSRRREIARRRKSVVILST